MSSELFIIEGIDQAGRKFRGIYSEQDARYLASVDCLNKVYSRSTGVMVYFTQEPTNRLEN